MIRVLDASVVIKWFVQEHGTAQALAYRDDLAAGKIVLAAPDLMLYEVAGVLRVKKEFTEDAIQDALRFLLDSGVEIFTPTEELLQKTVHLTFRANLSVYDCFYVALAGQLGAHLLTADQAIYKKAHALVPVMLVQ